MPRVGRGVVARLDTHARVLGTDMIIVITHENIKAHNPKILLITPPPLDEIQSSLIDIEHGHKEPVRKASVSAQYSETVRQVAAEVPGVVLVDLQKALMEKAISLTPDYDPSGPPLGYLEGGKRGALEQLLPDGLHISGEGYRVLFDIVKPHITLPNDYYVYPDWRISEFQSPFIIRFSLIDWKILIVEILADWYLFIVNPGNI